MSDGIFIFDRAGRLKRVNRAGAAMEHSHPRALAGSQVLRHSAHQFRRTTLCGGEERLKKGESVTIEVTPDRLNRPLLVSIEPVLDKAGDSDMAVVCTARDFLNCGRFRQSRASISRC